MKPKITELLSKFSHDLSDSEKYSIFREISEFHRAFKWNEWEFGLDLIDRPELIKTSPVFGSVIGMGIMDGTVLFLRVQG